MMSELRPIAQDLIKRVDDFIQNEIAHNETLIPRTIERCRWHLGSPSNYGRDEGKS